MPAFNTEAFIGEAIDSVLKQSVPDWELIVINDGSTDKTAEIIQEFKDPRIRFFSQKNAGASAARNRGIRESRSEMLMFLDSDDRLRSRALDVLGKALSASSKVCLAYGESVVMDEAGRVFGPEKGPAFSDRPSGNVLKSILQRNFMLPGAVLVRAVCLDRTGGFRNDLMVTEDWELWCRLASVGEFIYLGGKPVLEYRLRSDSTLRTHGNATGHAKRMKCIEAVFSNPEITKHFKEKELSKLRRKRVAAAYGKLGAENLRRREWKQARYHLLKSLRHDPTSLREIILLGAALVRWMPYALERRMK